MPEGLLPDKRGDGRFVIRHGWLQHKVEAGETLIRIANKYKIADYHKIIEWNPHIDPKTNMIRAGEYLWIKK